MHENPEKELSVRDVWEAIKQAFPQATVVRIPQAVLEEDERLNREKPEAPTQ